MNVKTPQEIAAFVKSKSNPLLVTGYLCDIFEMDGRKLIDYAADIAKKMDVAVAATANTVVGLRARGVERTKKMWAGEILNYMRDPWRKQYMQRDVPKVHSLMEDRPDVLILLGYDARVTDWLISGLRDIDTVALAPRAVGRATCTLPDTISLPRWGKLLDELVAEL